MRNGPCPFSSQLRIRRINRFCMRGSRSRWLALLRGSAPRGRGMKADPRPSCCLVPLDIYTDLALSGSGRKKLMSFSFFADGPSCPVISAHKRSGYHPTPVLLSKKAISPGRYPKNSLISAACLNADPGHRSPTFAARSAKDKPHQCGGWSVVFPAARLEDQINQRSSPVL